MAEGDLDITYADMHAAGDELKTAAEDMKTKFGQLKTFINDLVSDGYVTAESSGAFNTKYEEFTTGAIQTMDALKGLGEFLHSAETGYRDLDTQLEEGLRN
jgi:hypothetical protein